MSTKICVHCFRCGELKLTHEAPVGLGPVALTEWIERRQREAIGGARTTCVCGCEITYEAVPVSRVAPAGILPKDVTRPILCEVELAPDGMLHVRGKFLAGAVLDLHGTEIHLAEDCLNRVTLPIGALAIQGNRRLRLQVRNRHGHRGAESTAELDLDKLEVAGKPPHQ